MDTKDTTELVEPEAATWAWSNLWSDHDENHVKFVAGGKVARI